MVDASSYDTYGGGGPVVSEPDSLTAVTPHLGVQIQVGELDSYSPQVGGSL